MTSDNSETDAYLKKVSKGAAIIFFGLIISSALGYLTRLVIVRLYGIEDYGLFSLGVAIVGIATLFSMFGMQSSISRFISFYLGKKEPEKAKSVIFSSLRITLPTSIIASVFIIIFSYQISFSFFDEPRLFDILWAFVLMIPLSIILTNIISGLRGFQQMKFKVYSEDLMKSTSTLLLVAILFSFSLGILGILYSYIIGYVCSIILAYLLLKRSVPPVLNKLRKFRFDKRLLYFSLPLLLVSYTKMFMQWTDTVLLGYFGSTFSVGLYNIALPTAGLLVIFLTSFRFIFVPVISEIYAKKDKENLKIIFRSMNKWLFLIMFPFFLLMIFFPDNILSILFGVQESSANMTLLILSSGFFIFSLFGLSNDLLLVLGRTKILFITTLTSSAFNVAMNLLLIPNYGIVGAAIATSLSYIILASTELFLCYKYIGLQPIQKNYIKPVISGTVSVLVFYILIKNLILSTQYYILIIAFPFFLLLYIFLILIMKGLDKNDIMILKTIEKKIGIGSKPIRKIIMRFL